MSNENNVPAGMVGPASQSGPSGVGQTANIGRSTSLGGGAAKVFREFKWGLLALFLLMAVVIGLVYDGGRKKKAAQAENSPKVDGRNAEALLDSGAEPGVPPVAVTPGNSAAPTTGTLTPPGQNPVPPKTGGPIIIDVQPPPAGNPPTTPDSHSGTDSHLAGKGATPKPVGNAPVPPGSAGTYTVVSGDTLTSIASAHVPGKGGVKAILDANKDLLSNPNRLRVGMTLKIPSASAPVPDASPSNKKIGSTGLDLTAGHTPGPKAEGGSEYVVQNGDSLERIARKLFNDGRKWRDLFDWNRDQLSDPGHLRAGQTLKVKAATGHTTVSMPAPSTPRADAEEASQLSGQALGSRAEQHGGETQVMSATSSASLP